MTDIEKGCMKAIRELFYDYLADKATAAQVVACLEEADIPPPADWDGCLACWVESTLEHETP